MREVTAEEFIQEFRASLLYGIPHPVDNVWNYSTEGKRYLRGKPVEGLQAVAHVSGWPCNGPHFDTLQVSCYAICDGKFYVDNHMPGRCYFSISGRSQRETEEKANR